MKSNKFLSFIISVALIFGAISVPARANTEDYEQVMHNIAAKCAEGIMEDGNFIWFLADMAEYASLYPESENILSETELTKCKNKLLDFAKSAETGADLAKTIIGFRALGYDASKTGVTEKLAALIDAKSKSVTNIYFLPYVAIAMREYASEEQSAYLLKAMVKQKASWQDMTSGTDAATPMLLALYPYYAGNDEVKAAVDETIPLILARQDEAGLISNAPSTGLAIAALSAYSADDAVLEKLLSGLMGEETETLDGFLPAENSFGTEQGFRGLLAYELRGKKAVYDFTQNPKNELVKQETNEEQTSHSSGTSNSETENKEQISVTVKIMAHDEKECNNSFTYKHNASKYSTIASKTLKLDKTATVYDATVALLEEKGISYTAKNGYIAEIDGISEFDHGDYSGWMFMVNSEHQTVGCDYVTVTPNSTILWFYTDDYRYEKGSESFGYASKKEEKTGQEVPEESEKTDAVSDTAKYILNTVENPQISSIGGEWAVLGLLASGEAVPKEYLDRYLENVEKTVAESEGVLHKRKLTEYSRVVLALTLAGKNAQDVAGYDLTAPICDFEKTVQQGINGAIWALIALDIGNYGDSTIKEKYIEYILSRELETGGWVLSETEKDADCDVTAMALTALSNHCDSEAVKKAVDRGVERLSKMQNADGGFSTYGEETAESTAQVVCALAALGIDKKDARFVKSGKTAMDSLMTYYNEGKGFSHTKGGETNMMATEQAFLAISAQKRLDEGKPKLFGKNKFCDVLGNPNEAAIFKMAEKGIINGMSENIFSPEESVTRAQFATMIVRGMDILSDEETAFSDVAKTDWFYSYVASAYKNGIVYGVSETEFNPNGNITCEEAAAMIARAAKLCGIESERNTKAVEGAADWALETFNFCIDTKILDGNIPPKQVLTRAQISQMIYNMLEKAEKLD